MKTLLKDGNLAADAEGIGTVTRDMVRERAIELALISGRGAREVSQSDLEQARREFNGEPDTDPKEATLESAPESERWDPVHGSTGHKAPEGPGDDEDEEGRSNGERLVEEGIAEAEHDQMYQAAKEAEKEDRGEADPQINAD